MHDMNLIIQNIEETLTNIWKERATTEQRANNVFNNFYDRVVVMRHENIIGDDGLAMRILEFYVVYKEYRYLNYDETIKAKIEEESSKIINEINNI